jgi:hypothetical protein
MIWVLYLSGAGGNHSTILPRYLLHLFQKFNFLSCPLDSIPSLHSPSLDTSPFLLWPSKLWSHSTVAPSLDYLHFNPLESILLFYKPDPILHKIKEKALVPGPSGCATRDSYLNSNFIFHLCKTALMIFTLQRLWR